jgi:hypothetical protein
MTFHAERYGYISSAAALGTTSRAVASPAVNVLGNIQGYIEAT